MRHRKQTFKIGRTASHRRCMLANMLKSLIEYGRIETTVTKAKELRRHADRMVTLAKCDTLSNRRHAIAALMIGFNRLTPKEMREVRNGNTQRYNADRRVIHKLFGDLAKRFENRNGGYTRMIRLPNRIGDQASSCFIEYLTE